MSKKGKPYGFPGTFAFFYLFTFLHVRGAADTRRPHAAYLITKTPETTTPSW